MLSVFCRMGVPNSILTNQGAQFIGNLMQQLCKKLEIKIAPYHPQTNGNLERWHGTLVPMLKKSLEYKLERAKQIECALFTCRSALQGIAPLK